VPASSKKMGRTRCAGGLNPFSDCTVHQRCFLSGLRVPLEKGQPLERENSPHDSRENDTCQPRTKRARHAPHPLHRVHARAHRLPLGTPVMLLEYALCIAAYIAILHLRTASTDCCYGRYVAGCGWIFCCGCFSDSGGGCTPACQLSP
jgi:hypothetical protein